MAKHTCDGTQRCCEEIPLIAIFSYYQHDPHTSGITTREVCSFFFIPPHSPRLLENQEIWSNCPLQDRGQVCLSLEF